MYERKHDATAENKSRLTKNAQPGKELSAESGKTFPSTHSIPGYVNGRIDDPSTVQSHALLLRRAQGSKSEQAGNLLLQLQKQYGNTYVQRVMDLSRKPDNDNSVAPEIEQSIAQAHGGGQEIDSKVRSQMESSFGVDFSNVRVHTDSESNMLNHALNSRAFTTGQNIFFKSGEYNPASSGGRELLAHELTHVVQQTGETRSKLIVGQPGDQYEREADHVAQAIMKDEQNVVQEDSGMGLSHRQVESEEKEEETIQARTDDFSLQRQIEEEEEEE
ncbi:MAG: DUF4157 domain-containing protein, partial [Proteobacteria bacterium]|nr:DUF4157 domain-containing protein [Pseudomonadota bacterium]